MKVGAAFVQTFASQVLQSMVSLATGVLIARGLGPTGQGRYATFAAGIALGALLASLGQFHGNVLATANRRAAPRILLVRAVVQGSLVLVLLPLGLLVSGRALGPADQKVLAGMFFVVLSLEVIAQMVRGINLGQHHVTAWNVATLTQRVAYLLAVGVLALSVRLRLESVVVCWAIAALLSVAVSGGWIWLRSQPERLTVQSLWSGWGQRLTQSIRAFVTVGLTLLLVRADVWMLGPMLGAATVGQFSVATYLAEWLWYVPSILGNLLFAVVAADRSARSASQVARSARLVTTLLVVVMATLLVCGRWLVQVMYGQPYQQAGVLFTLLLPGMTALGIHLVVDSYFAGSGFPAISIWGALIALVTKIVLNLVVVPSLGATGAAGATTVVYCCLLALKVAAFARATGMRVSEILLPVRSDVAYVKGKVQAFARLRFGTSS